MTSRAAADTAFDAVPAGRGWSAAWRDTVHGYLFVAPFLAVYLVFMLYPLGRGFWISLHDWELVGDYREYIGFLNYQDLFADPLFWKTVRNTIYFTALTVPLVTVLGLALALALNRPTRLHALLRAVFFASSVFSVAVVTLIWTMVLNPDRGLVAHLFRALGLTPVNFLGNEQLAMPALVVTTLWWSVGLPMALFLAGLQQIAPETYEAAKLDNATPWTTFRRITLPALKRTLLLVIVLEIVLQFQVFGQALLMTTGGPADSTRTVVQYIYESGFRDWLLGYASAMAMLLFVLMFGTSMLQLYLGRRED